MKKILLTTSTLPLTPGDSEAAFVLDLALALQSHYEVTVLAPAAPGALLRDELRGVRIVRYRYAPLRQLETLAYPGAIMTRLQHQPMYWMMVPMLIGGLYLALRKLLQQGNFDLVHCHWFVPQAAVQALSFSGPQYPPFVVTSHGGDLSALRGRVMDMVYRRVIDKAAAVTVVSQNLQKQITPLIPDALVTPMGVDINEFAAGIGARKHAVPTILFVGRLVEKKGLKYLLEALSCKQLEDLDFQLLIAGDGPEGPSLKQQSEMLSLGNKVKFLGAVNHSELPACYASADVLCAPSVVAASGDIDGLPTVILEAAAAGTPCIGTTVGGLPDFIRHDENGLLTKPGDVTGLANAVKKILLDSELRQRLAESARKDASQYSWSAIANRFAAIYEDCMANPVDGQ